MNPVVRAYRDFSTGRFPRITDQDVAALEERINVSFPLDYREYLLEYNGGAFSEPHIVSDTEGCPLDRLTYMHGIDAPHPTRELGSRRQLSLWDENDPPEIVPIGYTIMGHFILLITHPDDNGCILLRTFTESYFLAEGIEEFFELVQTPLYD